MIKKGWVRRQCIEERREKRERERKRERASLLSFLFRNTFRGLK